jgi:hypothetical protein
MARIILLAVLILSASALFAAQPKSKEVLKRIDVLLKMYEKEHPLKHLPSTLKEFQQYAVKKGMPLDLTVFSSFITTDTVLRWGSRTLARTPARRPRLRRA